jgi:hypothetical protein
MQPNINVACGNHRRRNIIDRPMVVVCRSLEQPNNNSSNSSSNKLSHPRHRNINLLHENAKR